MMTKTSQGLTFLKGGGLMGERIRAKDWQYSTIGVPEKWPQSLRISVSILLNSQFPMFLWWGPELVTIYNDAYIDIAGDKHPSLLGKPGPEAWAEIWTDLSPLVTQVLKGASTWSEDQLLFMNRRGYVEETYFTFSYSPILNEAGEVGGLFCACIETTDKVLTARRLTESEKNLRNTILQSPVAMCILRGESYVVEIANERMYELWGKEPRQLLHRPIFKGLPEAAHQGLEGLLDRVFYKGEVIEAKEHPVTLPREDHLETVYINFSYRPFIEGDGSISGVIAVAIDVTEQVIARKKIEESESELQRRVEERTAELERKNKELEASNANLEEFAYAASHDMKEPIRKIHFFSDRLREELRKGLNPEQLRLFSRMELATRRMRSLIDDLLAYSDVGRGMPHVEKVDLNELVTGVLEDLELEITEKGASVHRDRLPVVIGHKRQLQQLLQNLVANALKYHKPGVQPEVNVRCHISMPPKHGLRVKPQDADRQFFLLEVEDNGIGFRQDDADRIFNVFTRLHGNAEYRGTGVGLSIARKVVENHKGYIQAEGHLGQGATFRVWLPVIEKDDTTK